MSAEHVYTAQELADAGMKRAMEVADAFYDFQRAIERWKEAKKSNVIRFPVERTRARGEP